MLTTPPLQRLNASIDRLPRALVMYVLLGAFAVQAIHAMRLKSPTFDETAHLPAGYSYVRTGDFRLNPEHPPFVKLLAGASLSLLVGVKFSNQSWEWATGEQWRFGQRFLYLDNEPGRLVFWGRLPLVLLACVLGALIYAWVCELYGRAPALCALVLFAFTPEFLAHGALVTTDMAAATFVLATWYFLWRCLKHLTIANTLLCGLSLGAALASKFNTVLFLPLFILAPCVRAVHPAALPFRLTRLPVPGLCGSESVLETRKSRGLSLLLAASCAASVALVVLWSCYGFHAALPAQGGTSVLKWDAVATSSELATKTAFLLRDLHLLPDVYLYGFLYAVQHSAARFSFLMGEYSLYGFRSYFPITALVKTPIPELVLMFAGCFLLLKDISHRRWGYCAVILPSALHLGVSIVANLNIGHRHLLPIYPFLIVVAAGAFAVGLRRVWSAVAIGVLLAWQAWGTLSCAPNYLAYFNESVGGSRGGIDVVVDSNLDWGQDLPGLKRWMDEAGVSKIYLSYFGSALPEAYGIAYEALPSFFELPGRRATSIEDHERRYVAISATNLQKVYLRDPRNRDFLAWMDQVRSEQQPVAIIGGSIYVYEARSALSMSRASVR